MTAQQDKGNAPNPVRLAGRVTRAFLGLRLDCAECHNHPFAAWKQADFQGFSAFFGQTHIGFTGVRDKDGEYEVEDKKTQAKKTVGPARALRARVAAARRARAARSWPRWVTHPQNPYFARATVNRVWALMFGRPLVAPVDNLESDDPIPPAMQILADDFTAHDFDLRRLIRVIACTQVVPARQRRRPRRRRDGGEGLGRLPTDPAAARAGCRASVFQSASVTTLNKDDAHRRSADSTAAATQFIQRYGDTGEDEFDNRGGTIPQRLLLMNGEMVRDRVSSDACERLRPHRLVGPERSARPSRRPTSPS